MIGVLLVYLGIASVCLYIIAFVNGVVPVPVAHDGERMVWAQVTACTHELTYVYRDDGKWIVKERKKSE